MIKSNNLFCSQLSKLVYAEMEPPASLFYQT